MESSRKSGRVPWGRKTVILAFALTLATTLGAAAAGNASETGSQSASSASAVSTSATASTTSTPVSASSGAASASADASTAAAVTPGLTVKNFQDDSAGMFPDTYNNATVLNAGNRGCNACHDDLWETVGAMYVTDAEATDSAGGHDGTLRWGHYGRKGTILDCIGCHSGRTAATGNYLGDTIHIIHYGSAAFTGAAGNCWSCHYISTDENQTDTGQYTIKLWEQVMYDIDLGGYANLDSNEAARKFITQRGFTTYAMTEVGTVESPEVTVTLDQPLSDPEDIWVIDNYVFNYEDKNETIAIDGLVDSGDITVADLEALPQTTGRATVECILNDINGLCLSNIEYTGVKLSDFIAAYGGFAQEGTNAISAKGYDGWGKTIGFDDDLLENAVIAYKYDGEYISDPAGAPAVLMLPGCGGALWIKHIASISFQVADADKVPPMPDAMLFDTERAQSTTQFNWVDTGWFQNDGLTFSMADGVSLTGYAFAWDYYGKLSTISFSTDFGITWTDVAVPADYDPDQWTTFDFSWNPPAAGTYIIKVKATTDTGTVMKDPGCASIIVNVTE